jgi:Putative restriction endonuclease
MTAILTSAEQRVVLRNVSWETYRRLLMEHLDASSPRFTFDRGDLEIMSPLPEHARYNVRIPDFVGVICEESNIEVEALGSTTFKRKDLERGFEADSCFYVQNADRVRNKEDIDAAVDPPPDLTWWLKLRSQALPSISFRCMRNSGCRKSGSITETGWQSSGYPRDGIKPKKKAQFSRAFPPRPWRNSCSRERD